MAAITEEDQTKETEKVARAVQKDFLTRMQKYHQAEAERYGQEIDDLEPVSLASHASTEKYGGM